MLRPLCFIIELVREYDMQAARYLLIFLCCLPVLLHATSIHHVRGTRYCEVITSDGWFNFAVYTTAGLNHCPQSEWQHITKRSVKDETGALVAVLNGPRYWVMDDIKNTALLKQEAVKFKALPMRKVADVRLGLLDLVGHKRSYKPHQISRDSQWTYRAGGLVYELISPDGKVYVMHSCSESKETQKRHNLSHLGDKLQLPEGWRFKVGRLKKTVVVSTKNNIAEVLQDDRMNSYQLAPYDLLAS